MSEREAFVVRTDATLVGDKVELVLTVDLPTGVHIEPNQPAEPYLIPTVLAVEEVRDVTVEYPPPVIKELGWNGVTLSVLEGRLTFLILGRVRRGTRRVSGTLSYQPCVGGACLPPRTVRWEAPTSGTSHYSVLGALTA
jgi:hypothetical protein